MTSPIPPIGGQEMGLGSCNLPWVTTPHPNIPHIVSPRNVVPGDKKKQAEVQQCLAQHIVASLSLYWDYLVVILWLRLWLDYG